MSIFNRNEASATIKINYKGDEAKKGLSVLKGTITTLVSAYAVKQVASYTYELSKLGATAESVNKNFENFARRAGQQTDEMMGKLRRATLGMVNDMELQQRAMQAMVAGVKFDDIITSMEYVTKFASATGTDVSSKMMTVMTGLARGSAQFLDDVGIQVIGSKDVVNDAIAQMREKMDQFTTSENDAAVKSGRLRAEYDNLRIAIGRKLVPAYEQLLNVAAKTLMAMNPDHIARLRSKIENSETQLTDIMLEREKIEERMAKNRATLRRTFFVPEMDHAKAMSQQAREQIKLDEERLDLLTQMERRIKGQITVQEAFLNQQKRRKSEKDVETEEEIKKREAAAKKAAEEKRRFEESQEEETLRMKKEMNDQDNDRRRAFLEDGKNLEIKIEEEKRDEIQSIMNEYKESAMAEEENYHDFKIRLYEDQKILYPQLEREINELIERENERHNKVISEKRKQADSKKKEDLERSVANEMRVRQKAYYAIDGLANAVIAISDSRARKEIENLERLGLSQEEYDRRRGEIEKRSEDRRRAHARTQQVIAAGEAMIDIAKASTGVYATTYGGFLTKSGAMALAFAEGLSKVLMIQAQHFQAGKMPKMQGTKNDDIVGVVNQRETIVPANQSDMHRDDLSAIITNTANTAEGIRRLSGGSIINNFYSVSTEQMLEAQKKANRYNRIGKKL